MKDPIVRIEHVRKEFAYVNPDANSNETDMWFSYILGLLGRNAGKFGARRRHIMALDDVSLAVRPGEFFGILGPNGAGKTTLIKILATILRPTSGKILVNGYDVIQETARARASLSVVPASGWLAFDMQLTLLQNLTFWGRLCGLDPATSKRRASEALNAVDLREWRNETTDHLSSGMRQRLAIAKGLLVRSPVFVLDEPTANVDPIAAHQVRAFLRHELNHQLGQTIVLTTHNMAEAEQLCDRVAIIDRGKLLVCDRPAALIATLDGKLIEITLSTDFERAQRLLREQALARHVIGLPDAGGTGRLRVHLSPNVPPDAIRQALATDSIGAFKTQPVSATMEDVFLWYAGRRLDGNGSADPSA